MFVFYSDLTERLPPLLDCLEALCARRETEGGEISDWVTTGKFLLRNYAGHSPSDWSEKIVEKVRHFTLELAIACLPSGALADTVQEAGCWNPPLEFAWHWALVAAQLGAPAGELYALALAARLRPGAYGTFLRESFGLWRARLRQRSTLVLDGRERLPQCQALTLELGLQAVARLEDAELAREVAQFIRESRIRVPLALFPLQYALDRVLDTAAPTDPGADARMVVLRSMQGSGREEERRVLERFRPLLRPMPLVHWPRDRAWAEALRREFPWMAAVIEALERQQVLAQHLGAQRLHLRPLLLVGPAGVGKTRFLQKLGEQLGVPTVFLSLAGSSDNMLLKGSARGWSSARPGFLVEAMLEKGCPNPLVILDELDKVGQSRHNGRVWETLLTLLEPASSRRVLDEYLQGEVDYSAIAWVATANRLEDLPGPLRSRWEIISVGLPQAQDFDRILENLQRELATTYGTDPARLPALADPIRDRLRRAHARNPGSMRTLRALIYRLLEMQAMAERSAEQHRGYLH